MMGLYLVILYVMVYGKFIIFRKVFILVLKGVFLMMILMKFLLKIFIVFCLISFFILLLMMGICNSSLFNLLFILGRIFFLNIFFIISGM